VAAQVFPQLIPAGVLVTVPLPDTPTVSVGDCDCWVNVAVTVVANISVTLQEQVPVHAPLHPVKLDPDGAVAARDTELPYA
jgi:hypothetical protein